MAAFVITGPMGPSDSSVEEFLRESNAIEGVYDEEALEDAKRAWGFLMSEERGALNPFLVMQVHELLMERQNLEQKYKGQFRDIDVWVGGRQGAAPTSLPYMIEEWCVLMNKPQDLQPADFDEMSKGLHVHYEKIHPFVDGNGRTGRMFMNWYRITQGFDLLIIHEGEEQMGYYKWFK